MVLPGAAVTGVVAAGLPAIQIEALGTALLQLRIQGALRDAECRTCLENAQASDLQAGIVCVGLGDQAVQQRIIKGQPPLAKVGLALLAADLLQGRAVPLLQPAIGRRRIVRADLGAAADEQRNARQQRRW